MMHPRLGLVGLLAGMSFCVLGMMVACSSNIFKGPDPVCGPRIERSQVRVLDMTGYEQNQDEIAKAVQEQVGGYHLMTQTPVWIPKNSSSGKMRSAASIVQVQSIAADWGCNLLILLDSKMARTERKRESRNEDVVWLVQAGMRAAP